VFLRHPNRSSHGGGTVGRTICEEVCSTGHAKLCMMYECKERLTVLGKVGNIDSTIASRSRSNWSKKEIFFRYLVTM
jgi:hypothetical protein